MYDVYAQQWDFWVIGVEAAVRRYPPFKDKGEGPARQWEG